MAASKENAPKPPPPPRPAGSKGPPPPATKLPPVAPKAADKAAPAKPPPAAPKPSESPSAAPKPLEKPSTAPASPATNPPLSGMMAPEKLVIMFIDLARFQIASRRVKDAELVAVLEAYYDLMVATMKPVGGRIVKFMGDGALVVFDAGDVDDAVQAVLALKKAVDDKLSEERHFVTPLVARVHVGEAMAGPFGPKGEKRYDVIGQAVNRTAAMRLGEIVSLTTDAYAALDGATKKLFKQKGDYYIPA